MDDPASGPLATGKVPPEILERLLATADPAPPDLVLGPGTGRDAAVVDLGDRYAVFASDPITFAGQRPGWHAVHVNANDVACLGAEPRWFLLTVLAPPGATETELAALFADVQAACRGLDCHLVGGHTEVTDTVDRLVLAGTMIGEAPSERLLRSDGALPGDALIQIGPIAIEGTAVLASEAAGPLRRAGWSDDDLAAARALLDEPSISVVPAARAVWGVDGLHALHDPTEGGLATACWELAQAAGLGLTIQAEAVLRHPLTDRIAQALGVDPLGLLASGSLLAAVDPDRTPQLLRHLHNAGLVAAPIGHLGAAGQPAILQANGATRALPRFTRDEVVRVLAP